MSYGSVNIQSFARNALLPRVLKKFERAHVMQAVGELHQNNANIVDHGQKHFANVFDLARLRGHHVQAADFRDAFDQPGDFRAETLLDSRQRKFSVLDNIMQ